MGGKGVWFWCVVWCRSVECSVRTGGLASVWCGGLTGGLWWQGEMVCSKRLVCKTRGLEVAATG